ncbi:MAG: efflux RND transporter periplasmic adaptor subunit [Pseudomonadota bacterium]
MKHLILGLAAGLVMLTACSGDQEPTQEATKVRPAKLVTATLASSERGLSFPAVIRAVESADLTFQIAGEILELDVLEGQEVKRGDVIARLNPRDGQNQVAQAKAEFENAQAEYERAERLAAQDAISRSVLETRRTTRDVAEAALDSAEKTLADTVLRSPFDGAVSQVSARRFQNVQAKELVATIQTEEVEAVINIPGNIIARIPQLIPLGASVRLDTAPDTLIQAEFREASGSADPETQTYEVSFSFIPPDNLFILPGMTATVDSAFDFSGATDIFSEGVSIPMSAILSEGGKTYVWLVDQETYVISKQEVSIGENVDAAVIVTSGLEGGETLIAAGVAFFNEGATVRSWQP